MSAKAEQTRSWIDTTKLTIAALLLVAGIVGFYYFETWQGESVSFLYRTLGLLAVAIVAAGIAIASAPGKHFLRFMQDSRTEVRKMVWPTRNETLQTTLMVIVIVLILAIFLWIVDMILGWGVRSLLGGA